jgi:hypothetical protein
MIQVLQWGYRFELRVANGAGLSWERAKEMGL